MTPPPAWTREVALVPLSPARSRRRSVRFRSGRARGRDLHPAHLFRPNAERGVNRRSERHAQCCHVHVGPFRPRRNRKLRRRCALFLLFGARVLRALFSRHLDQSRPIPKEIESICCVSTARNEKLRPVLGPAGRSWPSRRSKPVPCHRSSVARSVVQKTPAIG